MTTWRFADKKVKPSEFLGWLDEENIDLIEIDKNYWK